MKRPRKLIKSLIKEMENLKLDGPDGLVLRQLTIKYEAWYTNALRIVQNLVPERLEDFVSAYKNNRNAPISYSSYTIQDYLLGIKADRSSKADYNSNVLFRRLILRQVGILSSALRDRPLSEETSEEFLQTEFYKQALDQAQKLFEMGKIVAGGVVVGTVLDNYLQWMCARRDLKLSKKQRSLAEMNNLLYKFRAYPHTTWIRIQSLIPVAEACLNPKKKTPPKKEIVTMIADVRKVVGAGL